MLKERINIYFGLKKDKCHKGKFHQDKCCLEEYDFTGVYCKTSQKFGKIHLSHTDSHINTVVVQNCVGLPSWARLTDTKHTEP